MGGSRGSSRYRRMPDPVLGEAVKAFVVLRTVPQI